MKSYLFFLFLLCVAGICNGDEGRSYAEQPAWDATLNLEEIEQELQISPIVYRKSMKLYLKKNGKRKAYIHKVYFVKLANGLKAVFKPEANLRCAYGEVAAYKASKWLGQRLVPPTILKEHNGRRGSLQFFVESPFDLLKANHRKRAFNLLSDKAKSDPYLFYFVFWGKGTHYGNQIVGYKNGVAQLALIDNAALMSQHKRRRADQDEAHGWHNLKKQTRMLYDFTELQSNQMVTRDAKRIIYPRVYSQATLDRYKELSLKDLHMIFSDALKEQPALCPPGFFKHILKRRDQLFAIPNKVLIP